MILGVFSVRDVHTGFLPVTCEHNDESAKRNFRHACRNVDSLFFSHAKDYDLYKVGTFNTDTGALDFLVPPQLILSAADCIGGDL